MLETPLERGELLKAGIGGKMIKELHIICNNFKIVHNLILYEKVLRNSVASALQ